MVNTYNSAPDAKEAQAYRKEQAARGAEERKAERGYDRDHTADQGKEGWEGRLAIKEGKLKAVKPPATQWLAKALPNTPPLQTGAGAGANGAGSGGTTVDPAVAEMRRQINSQHRHVPDAEREERTAASTAKARQEIDQRDQAVAADEAKQAARASAGMPSIFVDPDGFVSAVGALDAICKHAWVHDKNGRPIPSKPIADKIVVQLLTLQEAIQRLIEHGQRDLTAIVKEHKGWMSKEDVTKDLGNDFAFAESNVGLAVQLFRADPPQFQQGAYKLVAALRFNKRAADAVSTWSKETIDAADKAVKSAQFTRNAAISAFEVCVIVAAAPAWGAELVIHGGFVVLQTGLSASDSHFDGKAIPWGELTAGAVLSMVMWGFGKWFDKGLEDYIADMGAKYMVKNGSAYAITAPQALAMLTTKQAFTEMKFIVTEELNGFADDIFKRSSGANGKMSTLEYVDACVKKRFTKEHVFELIRKRKLDYNLEQLKGKATALR